MKRKITGDKDFADIVIANIAIDRHEGIHGNGNVGRNFIQRVTYQGVTKLVEVTTRKSQFSAHVLSGSKRELSKIFE